MHHLRLRPHPRWVAWATIVLLPVTARAYEWNFETLGPGVIAALQPADQRFSDSNSLILIGDDAVALVDTQENPEAVESLLDEIERRTDLPLRYVINTHWHTDHVGGNGLVRARHPGVVFLGAPTLVDDVPTRTRGLVQEWLERYATMIPQAEEQLALGNRMDGTPMTEEEQNQQATAIEGAKAWVASHQGMEFIPPALTPEGPLRLHLGGLTAELHTFAGHTRGDTVVRVPEAGVLAVGDLIDAMPYAGHGYPQAWVETLTALAGLEVDTIVPGHGPLYRDQTQLRAVQGFLEAVVAHGREQHAAGVAAEVAAAKAADAEELVRWRATLAGDDEGAAGFFDQVLGEAVERAIREAAGTLPD